VLAVLDTWFAADSVPKSDMVLPALGAMFLVQALTCDSVSSARVLAQVRGLHLDPRDVLAFAQVMMTSEAVADKWMVLVNDNVFVRAAERCAHYGRDPTLMQFAMWAYAHEAAVPTTPAVTTGGFLARCYNLLQGHLDWPVGCTLCSREAARDLWIEWVDPFLGLGMFGATTLTAE
jgi:hypothetical protein